MLLMLLNNDGLSGDSSAMISLLTRTRLGLLREAASFAMMVMVAHVSVLVIAEVNRLLLDCLCLGLKRHIRRVDLVFVPS